MEIKNGNGKSKFGKGIDIELKGTEVASAILAYLTAHDVLIHGPMTIRVNNQLCKFGSIYIDPSGFVIHDGERWDGRTGQKEEEGSHE